ncbi:MAG: LEA type 2 family protein [Steroidobacteraceae bacterium]|jgi:LEA14-like dessication related protein|nr:LEA type 2 family protein [Steroidobacteraceae bacterium]
MNPRHRLVPALFAVAALGAAGCAGLVPKLETPQLSVIGVEVLDAQLLEQRFSVRMRVRNPNDRDLPIRGLSYTMQVAGQDFGRGMTAKAFTVPALGEAEFDMIVTTNLAGSLLRILPQLERNPESIEYRLEGRVNTDLGLVRSIPFVEKGRLSMK